MGLPQINIIFEELGITAIQRSQKGTVGVILVDNKEAGEHVLYKPGEIPTKLGAANTTYLKDIFKGYVNPPKKVILYVVDGTAENLQDGLRYFGAQSFDYLVGPPDITAKEADDVASWVKSERLNRHTAKAVLPKTAADHEGVVNFTSEGIQVGSASFTTEQYCGRIAGIIAGTPMTISSAFAPLAEVTNMERPTTSELDHRIDNGEFIIFYDGEKVKTGRPVNSLKTTVQGKGDQFKKIKIIEAMDMIQNDIRKTAQDNYIGKYANSYDNKCLLITAIRGYFRQLELAGILEKGTSQVDIDVDRQEAYLQGKGVDTADWTVQRIKEANTSSQVFLKANVTILDAIEDIDMVIAI